MKLIVGLGNPGKRYEKTRHNAGFCFIDKYLLKLAAEPHFVRKYNAYVYYMQSKDLLFVKPQTFMNSVGMSINSIYRQYKIKPEDLYVVYDDLDIKLGDLKIQKGKGPKVHNGLTSIYQSFGKKDFWHVRLGIENRKDDISGEDYVLGKFELDEEKIFGETIEKAIDKISQIIEK